MASEIFDKRSDFFKGYFLKGLGYKDYVATGTPDQQKRWQTIEREVVLNSDQERLLKSFKREINVLAVSGTWCGDCSRQGPMIDLIASTTKTTNVRFLDNNENPELRDELRIAGGTRVPTIVALSEDFFEIARFGDRHLSVYRRKAKTELGDACEAGILPPPKSELAFELNEWVEFFEKVHLVLRLSPFLRRRHGD